MPTYTTWVGELLCVEVADKVNANMCCFFVFEVHAISTHAREVLEKIEYSCKTQHSTRPSCLVFRDEAIGSEIFGYSTFLRKIAEKQDNEQVGIILKEKPIVKIRVPALWPI